MLVRAASRRVQKHSLQRNLHGVPSDSLFLPFLYPSYTRDPTCFRRSSSSPLAPAAKPQAASHTGRVYSTSTQSESFNGRDDFPDFLGNNKPATVSPPNKHVQSNARRSAGAPQRIVMLDPPTLANQVTYYRPELTTTFPTTTPERSDLVRTFHACLRIGRISRAQKMLENLTGSFDRDSPLLIEAHNAFLKALLNFALAEDGTRQHLTVFFMWYEDKMEKIGIKGDVTTFALLLKGSLVFDNLLRQRRESQTSEYSSSNRSLRALYVKRYVSSWKADMGGIGEVLESPLLTDEEVKIIARICALKVDELHEKRRLLFHETELTPHPITTIEEVKPTPVKGHGLTAVRKSLQSLTDPNSMPGLYAVDADDIAFQIERQKLLEEDAVNSAREQWKQAREALNSRGILAMPNSISDLVWQWHQALLSLIKEEVVRVKQAEKDINAPGNRDRAQYGPYLQMLPPKKIASIVIIETLKFISQPHAVDGVKSSVIIMGLGKPLEQESLAADVSDRKNHDIFGKLEKEELAELFSNKVQFRAMVKKAREKLAANPQPEQRDLLSEWPLNVKVKLGAVLVSMLLHCAKQPVTTVRPDTEEEVTQYHPAFYHAYDYVKGRKLGVVRAHPDVMKRLGNDHLPTSMITRVLPMLVVPRRWTAWNDGAYYYNKSRVVRTNDCREQEIYVRAASARGDLEQIFEGLNILGQTAWRINKNVFDVVLKVWNTGEEFANIPPTSRARDIPPEPTTSADPAVRADWIQKVREIKLEEQNNHSQRCDINFKVEIARALLFERFYYPHNVDFRGRAYPIPPNLNHIGNDLSRGLLMFNEAKELGERGLEWLKIHLANVAGYDKASFSERVEFANQHAGDIVDSAENPLEGRKWWLQAEDPWQCLAACFALAEALKLPDPTKYMCHIPVAQDGSCNGLQHYAALGGDMVGAKQVNLEPSDRPQDVYTGVADLVKQAVERDAAQGHELAKLINGHITRKIVKQTVMTNVYGVTFIGARAQIAKQLENAGIVPREQLRSTSLYLTRLVFGSIKSMFTGATSIQSWLSQTARNITRSVGPAQIRRMQGENKKSPAKVKGRKAGSKEEFDFMASVVWTTPLGLPVVQPYRKEPLQMISTKLQRLHISDPNITYQVNSRKQATAFPPNFFHSLDATHMLKSAVKSAENGLTFASVHDSFWTHPCDVDTLNRILRDAFVDLHSEDLMAKLLAEFETRYKDHWQYGLIKVGVLETQEIREAREAYLASKGEGKRKLTPADELLWEIERQELVSSEDPEERARGEAMVTPSVILRRAGRSTTTTPVDHPTLFDVDGESRGSVATGVGLESVIGEDVAPELNEIDDDAVIPDEDDVDADVTGEAADEGARKRTRSKTGYVGVWSPLQLPPLPDRGGFDVSRLKASKYFFS